MIKSNFIDYFDKVYIINLPHRADRREEIEEQLKKVGLALNHPKVILFNAIKPDAAGAFPNIGAKGCFLSHLGVLKDAQLKQFKQILIFEDDLDLTKNFIEQSEKALLSLIKNDWDIFYGDYRLFEPIDYDNNAIKNISAEFRLDTTNFLGIKNSVISPLVDYLEQMLARPSGHPLGGPMHVDGAYNWFRRELPAYTTTISTPKLGFQRSSDSDIADLSWKNRLPLIKLIKKFIRKIKKLSSNA